MSKEMIKIFLSVIGGIIFFYFLTGIDNGLEISRLSGNDIYSETAKTIELSLPDWETAVTVEKITYAFLKTQTKETITPKDIKWKLLGKTGSGARVYEVIVKKSKDPNLKAKIEIKVVKDGDFYIVYPYQFKFKTADGKILSYLEAIPIFTESWAVH